MLDKRLGQLSEGDKAWLKLIQPDGRIHGRVLTTGTRTRRMTHANPNLAQVPNSHAPYGPECRSLFRATPGLVLVGCDADGLEARCLAHYMAIYDGGEYVKVILEGRKEDGTDVHSLNAGAIGTSRNTAKTFFYAFMYGGGMLKLGQILADDPNYADVKHDPDSLMDLGKTGHGKLMDGLPALAKLTKDVKRASSERGFIKALDGGTLISPSQHSALNTLLQSAGAIVMKRALVMATDQMLEDGLPLWRDIHYVLNVHDEIQTESPEEYAERVGQIVADSIRRAGEYYEFRCPLAGSYDIGPTWAETH
jgi:DNA polymerase I-like protein with 3'-5' exonuclease and polymerase domains